MENSNIKTDAIIIASVGFCRGSRVKGNMSRVEGRGRGSMSRVKKNIFS